MDNCLLTEELLTEAVELACKTEDSLYEKTVLDIPHRFSAKYRKEIKKLLVYEKEKQKNPSIDKSVKIHHHVKPKKRYLLIAAIIMLMASMTAMAVEPIREKVIQMIEKCFSDHTEVTFEGLEGRLAEEQKLPEEFIVQKLTYVPERYTFDDESVDEEFYDYTCTYLNEEGYTLVYSQMAVKYFDASITSDGSPAVPVTVKGKEAYCLKDEYGCNTVLYINDGYVYLLSGDETVQTLIDIFEKNKNIK